MTRKLTAIFIIGIMAAPFGYSQNVALADMQQDLALMKREVGQLRLEVEQLRRDNEAMSRQLGAYKNSTVGSDAVRSQVNSVRSEVSSQNEALKREIIAQVRKDMEAMAAQTNAAMEKLAKAIGSRPQAALPVAFGDSYPKTGITYTVKSGDSISKIARQNNSKIKWIQDANKISDVNKGLRIGEEIFVPQQ